MREVALRFGGPRHEHAQAALARRFDGGEPERRLADPCVSLEDERRRALARPVEEGVEGRQFLIPSDDLGATMRLATHESAPADRDQPQVAR